MCGKVLWVLRIITWAILIIFGLGKFWWWSEWMAELGSAATNLLPFLSVIPTVARWWIAAISEVVAWLFIISWCRLLVSKWAILALLIMVFAWTSQWISVPLIIVSAWALVALFVGPGSRKFCPWACPCKDEWGRCCSWTGACWCEKDGSCDMNQKWSTWK